MQHSIQDDHWFPEGGEVRRRRKLEIDQERVRVMMKVMERFGEYVVAGKLH